MHCQLTETERALAELLWEHCPLPSAQFVKLCAQTFDWKKSTAYTMLKRLENKGLFENEQGTIQVCVTREAFSAEQSGHFVDTLFRGSLPGFLAAFARARSLSPQDVDEIRRLIDDYSEEE